MAHFWVAAKVRFEIPLRFRHLDRVFIRYASWDLAHVFLIDEREGTVLSRLYPVDKTKNAEGRRRRRDDPPAVADPCPPPEPGIAPLLLQLMEELKATGLPPAYLPKTLRHCEEEDP